MERKKFNQSKKRFSEKNAKKSNHSKKSGQVIEGKIVGNKQGYAFLSQEGSDNDVFIPASALCGAIDGDEVVANVFKERGGDRLEGRVVKILKHNLHTVVGTIQVFKGFSFVVSDNKRISRDVFLKNSNIKNAINGDKVVVSITKYDGKSLEGEVVEVLGPDNGNSLTDVLSIIRSYEFIEEFQQDVIDEAERVSKLPIENCIKNRLDLRDKLTITIDGDDSKDFDDAVSLEILGKDYLLGVHIADVGEYVKVGSELDKEAYKRGTSVYFPNVVLPMLPEELSNGICSLNEKEDRLTLSCIMKIDKNGKVIDYKICESVISSTNRMTYNNVTKILNNDEEKVNQYKHLVPMLKNMASLCLILEKIRKDRGSLDFEIPEPQIILDEKLEVKELVEKPRTISERMIESFMLLANETVAEHFYKLKIPFVYRVHEKPDDEKITMFNDFVSALGLELKSVNLSPKDIQVFLSKLDNSPMQDVVNKVLLRAMQKAKYSNVCLGHFGLAATYYCHFTSPIRRYPDLTIHRIIKDYLHKKLNEKQLDKLKKFVISSSNQSSETELSAQHAERDVDDYFKARFMSHHLGENFEGVISGVTNFGIFVSLDNTVEGFIPLESLRTNNFVFNEKQLKITNGIESYRLGDKVKIKVVSSNLKERRINFALIYN